MTVRFHDVWRINIEKSNQIISLLLALDQSDFHRYAMCIQEDQQNKFHGKKTYWKTDGARSARLSVSKMSFFGLFNSTGLDVLGIAFVNVTGFGFGLTIQCTIERLRFFFST